MDPELLLAKHYTNATPLNIVTFAGIMNDSIK